MLTHAMKRFFILALLATLVAGCASTSEQEVAVAEPEPEPEMTQPEPEPMPEPEPAPLDTLVYFDFDQYVIKPAGRALLTAHAERLKGNNANVRIEGHCDERGTREYNMALGERRANAVRDFLVLQGVSRSRIQTVSYGEERPVDSRSNEEAWALNRRAEVILQ